MSKPTIASRAKAAVQAKTFKGSTVLTQKEFTVVAKSIDPNLFTKKRTVLDRKKSELALVRTQGTINEYLRPKGMVLRSRNYLGEFYVVKNNDAANQVVRYTHSAENATIRARILFEGITTAKRKKK